LTTGHEGRTSKLRQVEKYCKPDPFVLLISLFISGLQGAPAQPALDVAGIANFLLNRVP
jgi:hypothetical protein